MFVKTIKIKKRKKKKKRVQIQQVARAGLEPGTAGLRVRRADQLATLPPCSTKLTCFRRLGPLRIHISLSNLKFLFQGHRQPILILNLTSN